MTSPFSITASPTVVRAAPGSTAAVRVYDTGTAPLKVTASLEPVVKASGKCTVNATAVRDVTLTGRRVFTLQPGGHATATVRAGRKAPGQDLAVVFSGSPGPAATFASPGPWEPLLVSGPHGARTAGCVSATAPHRPVAAAAGQVTGRPDVAPHPAQKPGREVSHRSLTGRVLMRLPVDSRAAQPGNAPA